MAKPQNWVSERTNGFYLAAALLLGLLMVGTLGFELIEGWGLLESFYFAVITMSTVGYGEIQPLSDAGRIFASLFIICGMSITVYAFGVIGQTALEGELFKFRRFAKMQKAIDDMSEHTIVCGFGRLSRFVIEELREHKQDIVVIESEPMRTVELEIAGIPFLEGNAHDDEVLHRAGVARAKTLLAILPSDAENVYITLSAKTLNPNIHVVARASEVGSESKLGRAGADQVVSPFRVSSSRIVQNVLNQHVNDFLELATAKDGSKLALEQLVIPEASPLIGKTLEEAGLSRQAGISVAALVSPSGDTLLNPVNETRIEQGARVILFGKTGSFQKFDDRIRA